MSFFKEKQKIQNEPDRASGRALAPFHISSRKLKFALFAMLFLIGLFGPHSNTRASKEDGVDQYSITTYNPSTRTVDSKADLNSMLLNTTEAQNVLENSKIPGIFIGTPADYKPKRIALENPSALENKDTSFAVYTIVSGDGVMVVRQAGPEGIPDALSTEKNDSTRSVWTISNNEIEFRTLYGFAYGNTSQGDQNRVVDGILEREGRKLDTLSSVTEKATKAQYSQSAGIADLAAQNNSLDEKIRQLDQEIADLKKQSNPDPQVLQSKIESRNNLAQQRTSNNQAITSIRKTGAAQSAENNIKGGECGFTTPGNCLAQIAFYILSFFAWLVGIAGWLLNTVVTFSVVNMKTNITQISAINTGWTVVRDLVNICFIFILLYIAISTILGLNEHGVKHTLAKVIIFGILINFSMFFTKVIIDASNIFTLQFYTKILTKNEQGLGPAMMAAFKTPSIYNVNPNSSSVGNGNSDDARVFAAKTQHTFTVFILGIIMFITATGVLLGGAWIIFKRFIVFIFLLISSPLAFAGMILHSTEHHTKEWWSKLMAECIATPVFMIILWINFTILEQGVNNSSIVGDPGLLGSIAKIAINDTTAANVNNLGAAGGINVIFNFLIVTFLFSFALIAAQKLGASGAATAGKISDWTRGKMLGAMGGSAAFAYKYTASKWAHGRINKGASATELAANAAGMDSKGNKLRGLRGFGTKYMARGKLAVGKQMSKSYGERIEEEMKYRKAADVEMHKDPKARVDRMVEAVTSQNKNENRATEAIRLTDIEHHDWTDEDHANNKYLLEEMERTATDPAEKAKYTAALKRYYTGHGGVGRLTSTQSLNVQRIGQEKLLSEQKRGMDAELFDPKHLDEVKATARFKRMTDRQKADYLSTLSIDNQNKILDDKNLEYGKYLGFRKNLNEQLNNFEIVERTARGPIVGDKLKDLLSEKAFNQARGRQELFEELQTAESQNNQEFIKRFKDLLIRGGVASAGALTTSKALIDEYKKSSIFKPDKTFGSNDNNLNRVVQRTDEYESLSKEMEGLKNARKNSKKGGSGHGPAPYTPPQTNLDPNHPNYIP